MILIEGMERYIN